jgi:TnpA family transposase
MRFIVPSETWDNLLSDQFTGLNAIPTPGTLRDSLVLLAVVLEQQTELKPTQIMTDTGAYSDVVFGLFRLLSYRFSPHLADIGGSRFWRIDRKADYGKLNVISQHWLRLQRIAPHWDDMLRLSGSAAPSCWDGCRPLASCELCKSGPIRRGSRTNHQRLRA